MGGPLAPVRVAWRYTAQPLPVCPPKLRKSGSRRGTVRRSGKPRLAVLRLETG